MRNQQRYLQLNEEDHGSLTTILTKGTLNARVARRASGLLQLHQGLSLSTIAENLGIAYQTVADWRDKYFESGLEFLNDQPRSGRPTFFDGVERAKVTALACSDMPAGHAKWSLRLLADKLVELEYCESISHTQVGTILKKTNYSHICGKPGVSAK